MLSLNILIVNFLPFAQSWSNRVRGYFTLLLAFIICFLVRSRSYLKVPSRFFTGNKSSIQCEGLFLPNVHQ
jgi:hypothetical protein